MQNQQILNDTSSKRIRGNSLVSRYSEEIVVMYRQIQGPAQQPAQSTQSVGSSATAASGSSSSAIGVAGLVIPVEGFIPIRVAT